MQKKEYGDFNWRYWLYLPNLISLSRFITIPLFLWEFVEQNYFLAFIWAVVSIGSDILDGWLARKLDKRSNLGLILDPAGDYWAFLLTPIAFYYYDIMPQYIAVIISGYIMVKVIWIIFIHVNSEDNDKKIKYVEARLLSKFTTITFALVLFIYFLLSIPVNCIFLPWQNAWLILQNGLQATILFINIFAILFAITALFDYYLESDFHKLYIRKLLE